MKNILYLFIFLYTNSCLCQDKNDVRECMVLLLSEEDLEPIFFSLVDDEYGSILCIEGSSTFCVSEKENIYLKTEDFKEVGMGNVFVKSNAFIFAYDVEYWLEFDSIFLHPEKIQLYFRTTSVEENPEYTYLVGIVDFVKIDDEWSIASKEILKDKYISPLGFTDDELKSFNRMNEEMVKEAKEALLKRKGKGD